MLMQGRTSTVTTDELLAFHSVNIQLYIVLMTSLPHNPLQCVQILGFWLWLEHRGCGNTVWTILDLPTMIVKELADEAMTCLTCIKNLPTSSRAFVIPLTERLLKNYMSLQYLNNNRHRILPELQILVGELCAIIFTDHFEQVIFRSGHRGCLGQTSEISGSFANPVGISSSLHANSLSSNNASRRSQMAPIDVARGSHSNQARVPFSPHDPAVRHNSLAHSFPRLNMGRNIAPNRVTSASNRVSECDRTMFLTFSKGYPVSEGEIRCSLTARLGNSVEAIYMQEVLPGEQVLYARVVFLRPAFVDALLNGEEKAKYTINGKHVWMRRYTEKHRRR